MGRYRTLVFSPPSDLDLAPDEVMQVVNTLGAKLLQGKRATLHGLMDMLREPFEIFWVMGHGQKKGIPLSDGVLVASELTSLIRSAGVQLTVFNTCESYDVAYEIHQELLTSFVATVRPVPDRQAYITGVLFSKQLADGMDFYDAYEVAKPGNNINYVFLGSKATPMQYEYPRRGSNESLDLNQVAELVRQLQIIVRGNEQWNVEGVVPALRRLETKVDSITAKVDQLEKNQAFNRRLLLTLSVLSVFLMVAVGILLAMQAGSA